MKLAEVLDKLGITFPMRKIRTGKTLYAPDGFASPPLFVVLHDYSWFGDGGLRQLCTELYNDSLTGKLAAKSAINELMVLTTFLLT